MYAISNGIAEGRASELRARAAAGRLARQAREARRQERRGRDGQDRRGAAALRRSLRHA